MEASVLNWFYQTAFWRDNKSRIEIIPQFEIGQYLKQLDKTYEHPMYRVDFLVMFRQAGAPDKKIILEYDGFLEHFTDHVGINKQNTSNTIHRSTCTDKRCWRGTATGF